MRSYLPFLSTVLLVFLAFGSKSFASQVVWDGSASTSWENGMNWNTNSKPTASDSVFIPSGFVVSLSALTTSKALHVRIQPGSTLNIPLTSTLLVENSPGHGVENAGTVTCFGTITIRNSGAIGLWALPMSNTQIEALSSLVVEDANTEGVTNGGNFVNQGTVTIDGSGTVGLVNSKIFSNQGILNIWQSADVGLLNKDSLYNGLLNTIDILNPITISIGMHNQYGIVENLGAITVESLGTGLGVLNEGSFRTNLLTILNTSLALQNSSLAGSFWNNGLTTISICVDGILNRTLFTVNPLSTVTIAICSNIPLECGMYATFNNLGILTM